MSDCYLLKLAPSQVPQSASDHSFIGGVPKLADGAEIPHCKLCGAEECFFFQVAFPKGVVWSGLSLAVFACTSCADEARLVPQMLPGPLSGADVPAGFLESYQKSFQFLVFQTALATLCTKYREKVKFKPFQAWSTDNPRANETKIAGCPNWLQGDESPRLYGGVAPMPFLLQLLEGFRFEITEHAPRQIELGLDGSPQTSPLNYYQLFNGNRIFLFGTEGLAEPLVYVVTQVD